MQTFLIDLKRNGDFFLEILASKQNKEENYKK